MKDFEYLIRDVKDFPKPGIVFKDITPLLFDNKAVECVIDQFVEQLKGKNIDKVVGMESRGFLFGMLLAQKLNAGFVPIRKPGKLPHKTISESYSLEYGEDALEIHKDAIKEGEKVLIHDDVLATGGTAQAACNLIKRLKGDIVAANFLIELEFLNGKDKINDVDVYSIFKY